MEHKSTSHMNSSSRLTLATDYNMEEQDDLGVLNKPVGYIKPPEIHEMCQIDDGRSTFARLI